MHVGVLLDNTPEYLFALGGAALAGAAVVGINHTRREEHLLRDLQHTDCDVLISEPRHLPLLEPIAGGLPELLVSNRYPDESDPAVAHRYRSRRGAGSRRCDGPGDRARPRHAVGPHLHLGNLRRAEGGDLHAAPAPRDRATAWGSSWTSTADDIGYVCMPLFHSSALMVGWAPSLVYGASVGLGRRFSASGWLGDVRHYGATYTNYTGKPLAYIVSTPEQPDDAENTLRVAFGNEGSPEVVDRFARRFGLEVIDAYGATEGGVAVNRDVEARAGALGQVGENVKVVDARRATSWRRARFDADGRLANADECVGEIVNTAGAGPFEGYYNNDEANAKTLRFGWYWSGDLGYLDDDRYLYFAGRNADWLRVDGENFPAQPIETTFGRHPDVVLAAVYGVPDDQAGDQVMAGLVLRDGATFDPVAFAAWLDAQDAIGPKWRPRYVRILRDPPTTGTNKIVKRTLVHQKWRSDRVNGDTVYVRGRGDARVPRARRRAGADAPRSSFVANQRERFWDL